MNEISGRRTQGVKPLADCPYCDGEGTDSTSALGWCVYCYGTGRVARFLAERILERWARRKREADGLPAGYDGIEDEVPPYLA